jgi:hypothetical protein
LFLEELTFLEAIQLNLLDDLGLLGFFFAYPDAGIPVGVVLPWLKLQIIRGLVIDFIDEQLDVGGKVVVVVPGALKADSLLLSILDNRSPFLQTLLIVQALDPGKELGAIVA